MQSTVKCPHCRKDIEISEAFSHQIEDTIRLEESEKYKKELEIVKKNAEKAAEERVQQAAAKELKDRDTQISSLKDRAEKAEEEELKARKMKREMEEAKRRFELDKQRQLDDEREKIRKRAVEEVQEQDQLKFSEYEKKIADMKRSLEEAKNKAEQGSQQLQGEVLELDFEQMLRETFTDDEIIPVGKGQKGGDVIHKVKGKSGALAGIILWETKRAKWQNPWIAKLREDARKEGASMAVLLTIDLPKDVTDFTLTQGIVICSNKIALPLAGILRRSVLHIAFAKKTAENKDENLEMLYTYIQSESFRHRFESFAEGVTEMQRDLEYEKRAMERVWKKREVQIRKTLMNASRMYGELQGVMGNALPDIKTFSLESGDA